MSFKLKVVPPEMHRFAKWFFALSGLPALNILVIFSSVDGNRARLRPEEELSEDSIDTYEKSL